MKDKAAKYKIWTRMRYERVELFRVMVLALTVQVKLLHHAAIVWTQAGVVVGDACKM